MKILIACEFSGTVRDAFQDRYPDHWVQSVDLLPSLKPGKHHQGDIFEFLRFDPHWDLMIAHPPCTYLTISAEWAYGDGPYHQRVKPETLVGIKRRIAREEAISFVEQLWSVPIPRIAIENPIGCLSTKSILGKPTGTRGQVIQPHQFGEDASKATCLWLKNLPPLVATQSVAPRMINGKPRWGNQTDSGQNRLSPKSDRWAERSLTYPGIADAMAVQWGCF